MFAYLKTKHIWIVLIFSITFWNCSQTKQGSPVPPDVEKKPEKLTANGDTRIDNYYWLNQRENPQVIEYLVAENNYTDAVLAQIAARRPTTTKKLRSIQGIGGAQTSRYAKAILHTVQESANRPLPEPPEQKPRPESLLDSDVLARYDALRHWRTQRATERGVDPDIVFSNDTLLTIAMRQPTTECALQEIPEIGAWRAHTYGPEIFKIVGQVS